MFTRRKILPSVGMRVSSNKISDLIGKSWRILVATFKVAPAAPLLKDVSYHTMPTWLSAESRGLINTVCPVWYATFCVFDLLVLKAIYPVGSFTLSIIVVSFIPLSYILYYFRCLLRRLCRLPDGKFERATRLTAARIMVAKKGIEYSPAVWLLDTTMWEAVYGPIVKNLSAATQEVVVALAEEWDGTFGELFDAAQLLTLTSEQPKK